MISVENFYWILFENLLKPTELDAWYYHPFGTTANLSAVDEFPVWDVVKKEDHVLFHFDQEPLWDISLGALYEQKKQSTSTKILRILANSEHSDLKKTVCQSRGMLDWYFFYHGFAALDWFQDCQYVWDCAPIEKVYSSLNHLVTGKRAYRMALTARLLDLGVEQFGDISFHGSDVQCQNELVDPFSKLSPRDRILITQQLTNGNLHTKVLDADHINGDFSARVGHWEYKLWQRSFLHVVNETVFYDPKLHLTEKIFKPIVALRPFILVAAPGNLAYLRSYGFQTFDRWINESYDLELDHNKRLDLVAAEIYSFCKKPIQEIRRIHQEMSDVLEFNKQHFFNSFRQLIIDELVENFDTCVRVWNNCRVDERERPRHPDLEMVKRLLASR